MDESGTGWRRGGAARKEEMELGDVTTSANPECSPCITRRGTLLVNDCSEHRQLLADGEDGGGGGREEGEARHCWSLGNLVRNRMFAGGLRHVGVHVTGSSPQFRRILGSNRSLSLSSAPLSASMPVDVDRTTKSRDDDEEEEGRWGGDVGRGTTVEEGLRRPLLERRFASLRSSSSELRRSMRRLRSCSGHDGSTLKGQRSTKRNHNGTSLPVRSDNTEQNVSRASRSLSTVTHPPAPSRLTLLSGYDPPSPVWISTDPDRESGLQAPPRGPADLDGGDSEGSDSLLDHLLTMLQPSQNRLTMKLLGNRKALMRERLRQKRTSRWVIHPCSSFR